MVIWPKKISPDDAGWQQACALMQVLALDPRRPPNRAARHLGRYCDTVVYESESASENCDVEE